MVKFKVLDLFEKKELDQEQAHLSILSEEDIRVDIVHEVVNWQLANRRLGTKNIKNEAEVSGSGKKPHRQKGTGRARRGSKVSAGQRGGGFPHKPRTVFEKKLNKKIRTSGLKHVISNRYHNNAITVVGSSDDLLSKLPNKTKDVEKLLQNFEDNRILFVIPNILHNEKLESFMQASRNIYGVNFIKSCGLNVYDILKHNKLVMFSTAVSEVEERLCKI